MDMGPLRPYLKAGAGGFRRGETFWVYRRLKSGEIILSATPYETVIRWTRGFEAKETRNVILVMAAFGVFTLVWMWADHRAVVATHRARMVDELEHMVHERTEALKRMNRLAKLGEFAASLAHEIRNPLGSLVTAARLLPDAVGEEQEELVDVLKRESARLDRVLKDFLSFSKDPQPMIRLTPLNPLVRRSVETLRRAEDFGAVSVAYSLDSHVKTIPLDPDQMEQVFWNIALNGVHAMESRGTLRISTRLKGPWAEIAFRDEGPGIPEEKHEQIFEPFYTEKRRGTGLGLSIASRIVMAHGGFLQVSSQVGSWTEFTVSLPLRNEGTHGES
jgi:signal transduction histidine kinase